MNSYNIERVEITDDSLAKLVQSVLSANMADKNEFSAHDITDEIRAVVGDAVNIRHDKVKVLVHTFMSLVSNYAAADNGTYIIYQPLVAKGYSFVFSDGGTPVLTNKVQVQAALGAPEHWEYYYPESTAIARMSYEYSTNTLKIEFTSGSGEYKFFNVPLNIWMAFKAAESKGKFFYRYIKGNYQEG